MPASHVYHWKHGWIPLDHAAAVAKAHGDKGLATRMLADAHSSGAGIKSRRDVAKAVRELPSVPRDARDAPKAEIARAARRHGAADLLPSSWPRPAAEPLNAKTVAEFRGGSAQRHLVTDVHGDVRLTPERQALHDAIVEKLLAGHKSQRSPALTLMGGGPASGKSTMISRIAGQVPQDSATLNPDDVKEMLPEYRQHGTAGAAFTHEESSFIVKRATREAYNRRLNVTLDGVGDTSVSAVLKKVDAAKSAGYSVHAHYVTVPVDEAIRRSDKRAASSGRVVPHETIRQAHEKVSQVFPQVLDHFDSAHLYDNTTDLQPVLHKDSHGTEIVHHEKWRQFLAKAEPVARARVSIRQARYRGLAGFSVSGKDAQGRRVSVFVGDRDAAVQAAANIRAGRSAF